jgi:TRAP-type C4-dicarboxylate transport system substrate-binding protein
MTYRHRGVLILLMVMSMVLPGCVGTSLAAAATSSPATGLIQPQVTTAAPEFRLRLGSSSARDDLGTKTSELFGQLVELMSKGHVRFEFFPEGKLGNSKDTIEKVKTGAAEGYTESISNMTWMIPYASVLEMPLAFANPLDTWVALDGALGDIIKRDAEKVNLKICEFQDYGGRDLITSSKPIVKAEDLKGLKMRCMATSPVQVKMYECWGATPVPTTVAEILSTLKTGKIEGFDFPAAGIESRKFNEASKYVSLVSLYRVVNPITVNKAWFDSLPKDLQDIVMKAARQAVDWGRLSQERERMSAVANLTKLGMKINVLDPAEISKLRFMLKPLYDDARKQYPKEIVDLILGAQ